MHRETDPYREFLRARADKVFYRLPYAGNAGDSLIQLATQRILDDLHIRTTVDPREADVILFPGGNPTMWPDIGPENWRSLWTRYPKAEFIVGPAGFRNGYCDWARIINDEGAAVTALFARDPDSFRNLEAAQLRPSIVCALSQDPALYLRDSEWLAGHRRAATEDYDLLAFRADIETNLGFDSSGWFQSALPGRVRDFLIRTRARAVASRKAQLAAQLSGGGTVPLLCNDISRQRFEVFMTMARAARTVHTDRLHVMLLAALLGKKIFAYPTSHAKLEGVYQHSLKGWADVTFVPM